MTDAEYSRICETLEKILEDIYPFMSAQSAYDQAVETDADNYDKLGEKLDDEMIQFRAKLFYNLASLI